VMTISRAVALAVLVGVAAASRLLPHPPNVTPLGALALFGGAVFSDLRLAFGVPLAAMLVSDLVLGLHETLPAVYAAFALVVCIGVWVRRRRTPLRIGAGAVAGSVVFFVVTNFAVWLAGGLYPRTLQGLLAAYVAAIPFFRNTLAGDLVYTACLFGGFALLERGLPGLREPRGLPSARA
jgi:hypothetical protein